MAKANSTVSTSDSAHAFIVPPSNIQSTPSEFDFSEMASVQFDAVFTKEQIKKSEHEYNTTWGVKRRIALMFLTLSKSEMVERFDKEDGPDLLIDMVEYIEDYKKHLQAGIELADSASNRALCVASVIVNSR